MFADSDPFPGVDALTPPSPGGNNRQRIRAAAQSTTPTPIAPSRLRSVLQPEVAESSKSGLKRADTESSLLLPMRRLQIPRTGDGWYVVHSAALPGVYCGS
jgi:hypothetical protein